MARRSLALFLLFVLGLVLPAAGAPRLYCMRSFTPLGAVEDCTAACGEKSCCPDHERPTDPTCVAASKALPDAVQQAAVVIPALVGVLVTPLEIPAPRLVSLPAADGSPDSCRAPPDPLPLYLAHRSLLL